MKITGKTALWLVASVFFIASVHASTVSGVEDDGDTAAAKVDSVDSAPNPESIVDEVIWVVGDEAILLSDVENVRLQSEMDGMKWDGNPDCVIPEQAGRAKTVPASGGYRLGGSDRIRRGTQCRAAD